MKLWIISLGWCSSHHTSLYHIHRVQAKGYAEGPRSTVHVTNQSNARAQIATVLSTMVCWAMTVGLGSGDDWEFTVKRGSPPIYLSRDADDLNPSQNDETISHQPNSKTYYQTTTKPRPTNHNSSYNNTPEPHHLVTAPGIAPPRTLVHTNNHARTIQNPNTHPPANYEIHLSSIRATRLSAHPRPTRR
jgi:hypothetical protein